jgi:RES domain-containing protein
MKLWRISNYADLKGLGGTKKKGRWHNAGAPIVYLSEHPALAMLEVMVHLELDKDELPENYQLLEIEYSQRKGISKLSEDSLGMNWREDQDLTRALGDEWLLSGSTLLLKVPSAILPHSYNYLLNPKHTLAKDISILSISQHPFDHRLK